MENSLIRNNKINSSFVLTSRAFEQPVTANAFKNEVSQGVTPENYQSTVSQTNVMNKNQNAAVKYSAMANFSLSSSSALKNYNSYMKQTQLSK